MHKHVWHLAHFDKPHNLYNDTEAYYIGRWVCDCGQMRKVQYHDE